MFSLLNYEEELELLTLLTETNIANNKEIIQKTFKEILAAKYPDSLMPETHPPTHAP